MTSSARCSSRASRIATALLDGAALALSEQGEDFWIGCSYGSIAIPTEATDAAEALRVADQRMYAQKHAGRMSAARQVKESLLTVLGARDAALVRHARTVADLAEATARALDLVHAERETIRLAAELHEAGRLMLQGTLGVSDREVAAAGARVVASAPAIAHAAPLIGALHEPWQTIPVGARIIAVADAYDTVSAARGHDEALAEVRRSPRFDPDVLVAFAAICRPSAAPFIVI